MNGKMQKWGLILGVALAVCSMPSCKSDNSQSPATGNLTMQLVWADANPSVADDAVDSPEYATLPATVTTIRAIVSGSDMSNVQNDFDVSLGQGTIDNIPAGSDRIVTLQGLNSSGSVLYQGGATAITVTAGETTDVGTVTMNLFGFTVSAISDNTTESGGTATFNVRLNAQPTADVIIGVSSSDTTEGAVHPDGMTFSSLNWETDQTVTVTGVDDALYDQYQNYSIILAAATSTDTGYSGLDPADLSLLNIDDEWKLSNTGQTSSYTATFGEDSDYLINPPSYTDNGDGTITDNNTGLVWQTTDDDTIRTWSDAVDYCNNNTAGLPGTAWRLPTVLELYTILNSNTYDPIINALFTGTDSSDYWSSTAYADDTNNAWHVDFYDGVTNNSVKTSSNFVRCVRGDATAPAYFTDNDDGTIYDASTGLTWQKGEAAGIMNWENALDYCENSLTDLGGKDDWRLPNRSEIQSLVDFNRYDPAVDTTFFPDVYSTYYWSSTTFTGLTTQAWYTSFTDGQVNRPLKTDSYRVRCVRGGL